MKRVKMVVKMFWKRLGSDWWNSARSTTEKSTGGSGPHQGQGQGPHPIPSPPRPHRATALPQPRIQRQVNMRMRTAAMDGKDWARFLVSTWRLVRKLWAEVGICAQQLEPTLKAGGP